MSISHLKIQYSFQNILFNYKRIRAYGIIGIAKKIAIRTAKINLGVLFFPIAILFHYLGYRRLETYTLRIGHLAIEPDLIIKAQQLGLIAPKKWILSTPRGKIANTHLLSYWRQHFIVIESSLLCFGLDCLTVLGLCKLDTRFLINQENESQFAYQVYSSWGKRGALLSVSADDQQWFTENKTNLGLPNDCWFVCVHARESGFSPIDEEIQGYRNSSISNLNLSINEIIRRGGWIVRIGDPTSVKLPARENVIDYAHHSIRSDRMDILLCANARFLLGNTSGICLVASIFGVPCALANMVPMSTLGISKNDISIPKIHVDRSTGAVIPFKEIMSTDVSNFRHQFLYKQAGIDLIENSQEEILDLVLEMLSNLEKNMMDKKISEQAKNKFLQMFRPGHYSYGSQATVCEQFFQNYLDLL